MTAGDDLPRQPFPPESASLRPPGSVGATADQAPPWTDPAEEAPPARSFVDDLRNLAADTKTAIAAEKAYQGSRASFVGARTKGIAINFVLAAGLGYFALVALVVGLVLALTPLLTAWGAMALVTLTLAAAAFVFCQMAMKRLKRMRTVLALRSPEPDEARP